MTKSKGFFPSSKDFPSLQCKNLMCLAAQAFAELSSHNAGLHLLRGHPAQASDTFIKELFKHSCWAPTQIRTQAHIDTLLPTQREGSSFIPKGFMIDQDGEVKASGQKMRIFSNFMGNDDVDDDDDDDDDCSAGMQSHTLCRVTRLGESSKKWQRYHNCSSAFCSRNTIQQISSQANTLDIKPSNSAPVRRLLRNSIVLCLN